MCDGLFLIEDTAKHNGFEPDPAEIIDHIIGCNECAYEMDAFDEYADEMEDEYGHA